MQSVIHLRSRVLCTLLCVVLLLFSGTVPFCAYASVAADVPATLQAGCTTADGETYKVTVRYGDETGIPSDALLEVAEISETDARYADCLRGAQSALSVPIDDVSFACLLDITITDKNNAERHYQPAEGTTVDVRIRLSDAEDLQEQNVRVLHYASDTAIPHVLSDVDVSDDDLRFATTGFSAYAIVTGPEPAAVGFEHVTTIAELASLADVGVYIGHVDGYYFTNGLTRIGTSGRTGLTKTKPASSYPPDNASLYYFEFVQGSTNQFKAYCYDDGGEKQYVRQNTNSLSYATQGNATIFTIEPFDNQQDVFRVKGNGGYYWNMQGNAAGQSFAAYNRADDDNARLYFWKVTASDSDVYGLDGQTFGLMTYNGGVFGKALMANEIENDALQALNLAVLGKLEDRSDRLFVPDDSDISMWTFEWAENDRYYLRTNADGSTKYLKITAEGLALVSEPDNSCKIRVIPGSGARAGQICLRAGNATLTYSGNIDSGFSVGGPVGSEWLHLVETAELTPDYLMTYTARKVSVSDPEITNGSRVILYTRVWNDDDKRYEFYAVDYDGTLVPCYETGDSIRWVGNRINTELWNFVEYYWEGTNEPNYYYELYNQYSEQFIAPQVTDGQILSDDTIGINLNGRRNGYYYSTILAWDDAYYAYAGLKVEGDHVVSCPRSEADDFYFAIIQDNAVDDTLTLVDTIDNPQYGITLKMIDFTDKVSLSGNTMSWNEQDTILNTNVGGAVTTTVSGLLSTDLDEDGYPIATATNRSFSELYDGATVANHLFIQSIYNASGYFEYDSTQNFASLDNGNFKVYQELGAMDNGTGPTRKHGQFMPYNDLEAGVFSSVNAKNLYNALAQELPDTDPRKYEQMYLVRNPDYYFGMELEASFVQTPNGHDAWGHDIIYEFTGDDDFWLYVDGELVIDLGGIHSALLGTVNFCTGVVNVNGRRTTLRDTFYNNYIARGFTPEQAQAKIDELFHQNSSGQWVFNDYTTHTMRIFYMERGAGASNLHMRFNLASVKPGTVLLSKEVGNVDATESIVAEYPYQIWYKKVEDESEYLLTEDDLNIKVYYKDTITPVTYRPSITIDGVVYPSVFLLKPGEIAEINLPDDAISYRIVECGLNTDVYEGVYVNGTQIEGTPVAGRNNREDYGIDYEPSKMRPRVVYRNDVDPDALRDLTIRKVLYDETGENELHNDPAVFTFRLYFGTEYDSSLSGANMVNYHVKDENGVYCVWDHTNQCFLPLGAGKTDYTQLTAAEKAAVSFATSMNGSISKIPAFYTVEVREILAGTQYKVEERDYEIPDGYSRQKYVLYPEGLSQTGTQLGTPAQGTIEANKDPHVDVCNLKGWGLRIYKQWTDASFMAERGPAYFAVFTGTSEQNMTLVPGTVRRLTQSESTLYWYFQTLPVNVPFEQYEIREVAVTNPTVDADGYVTQYDSLTMISDNGEIVIGGRQIGESQSSDFTYTVLYHKGTIDDESNVRVDMATNNRPGIVLKKMEWDGSTPLANAQFTLKDDTGTIIGTFTSDENGLITVAFLRKGVDYTLTEIRTPQGYLGPDVAITIRLNNNGTVTITGVDAAYYTLTQGLGTTPTLAIKNHPYDFEVVKKDADTDAPLAGVHFALHRQVTVNGVTTIDFNPMPGYEDLVTDANGIVPRLDDTLPPGTYELRERSTLSGYQPLPAYIRFTVSRTGEITLNAAPVGVTLIDDESNDGTVTYVMTVPNTQRVKVSVWKTGQNHTAISTGATFELYRASEYNDGLHQPLANAQIVASGTTGEDGILYLGELPVGEYRLVETQAPDGYCLPTSAIRITVTPQAVTAVQGSEAAEVVQMNDPDGYWVAGQDEDTWQVRVWNITGVPLPRIGGVGTHVFYVGGALLTVGAAAALYYRRRRRVYA